MHRGLRDMRRLARYCSSLQVQNLTPIRVISILTFPATIARQSYSWTSPMSICNNPEPRFSWPPEHSRRHRGPIPRDAVLRRRTLQHQHRLKAWRDLRQAQQGDRPYLRSGEPRDEAVQRDVLVTIELERFFCPGATAEQNRRGGGRTGQHEFG